MKIGPFSIHRKVQDDLVCTPIVCVHEDLPAPRVGSQRVFCLWSAGGLLWAAFGKVTLPPEVKPRVVTTYAPN